MAQHFDVSAKLLLGRAASALFRPLLGGGVVRWHNVELPVVKNQRADLVGEMETGEISYLEIDSQNEAELPREMCFKFMQVQDRFRGKKVNPVLLYIGRGPMRHESPYAEERIDFRYELFDIREFEARLLLDSPDLEDNMLALLTADADKERVMAVTIDKLARAPRGKQKDLALVFVIVGGLRGVASEIMERVKTMVTIEDLLENEVLGPALRDRFAAGREEGERKVLVLQLERRFGPLTDAHRNRIHCASEEQVTRWAVEVLSASRIEDVLG